MKREGPLPIKAETWDLIQRLVGFDTTSRDSNLGLIEWVRDWLKGQGVDSRLTYDPSRTKANLFATIHPGARPGIVLSGHTDVVPWTASRGTPIRSRPRSGTSASTAAGRPT